MGAKRNKKRITALLTIYWQRSGLISSQRRGLFFLPRDDSSKGAKQTNTNTLVEAEASDEEQNKQKRCMR